MKPRRERIAIDRLELALGAVPASFDGATAAAVREALEARLVQSGGIDPRRARLWAEAIAAQLVPALADLAAREEIPWR